MADRQTAADEQRRRLNERLRAASIAGAEEQSRRTLGRGLMRDELDRVLRRYPGAVTTSRLPAVLLVLLLVAGCQQLAQLTGPETIVPAGIQSSRNAADVTQMMLAAIAADEKALGRSLALPRIVRIQLLHAGEPYEAKHFDGTNPGGLSVSPNDGPGWVVEAVGTFVGVDPRTGRIDAIGSHGFHLWDDAGGETTGFIPCWTLKPMAPEEMEGVCEPPGT